MLIFLTNDTGGMWSLIWSIGRTPLQIMSALLVTKFGNTSPGQSHNTRSSAAYSVYRIVYNKYSKKTISKLHTGCLFVLKPESVWFFLVLLKQGLSSSLAGH